MIPQTSTEYSYRILGPDAPQCRRYAEQYGGALKLISVHQGEIARLLERGQNLASPRVQALRDEIADLKPKTRIRAFEDRKGATWFYDPYEADRVIRWIERFCRHRRGKWRGKPFILSPFQRRWVRQIFGWFGVDGNRKHREVWIEIPRKNGKSTFASAVALYLLMGDRENAPQVFSVAGNEDQAKIVYGDACAMVDLSPDLERVVDHNLKIMRHHASDGEFKPLGKGNQHGLNPHGIIGDEVHEWKGREQYDAVSTADGSRDQPLAMYITTAGYDITTLCGDLHRTAVQVKAGILYRPDLYVAIYSASVEDDWKSEATWHKANPGLKYGAPTLQSMRTAYNKALSSKAEEGNFKRFKLNIWTGTHTSWISHEAWKKCEREIDWNVLRGDTCFAGLDLAKVTDLSALALLFPPGNSLFPQKWVLGCRFWCPAENVQQRARTDQVTYQEWIDLGLLNATPGNTTDFDVIESDILAVDEMFNIEALGYDPFLAQQIIQHLDEAGMNCVEVRQGMLTLAPPTAEFERLTLNGGLVHGGHDIMGWCVSNTVCKPNAAGDYKPDKSKSNKRIDGAVAAINANAVAMTHEIEDSLDDFLRNPAVAMS